MNPCKKNKCLKYPACKNREEIYCNILWEYTNAKTLPKVRRIFPNCTYISQEKDPREVRYDPLPL